MAQAIDIISDTLIMWAQEKTDKAKGILEQKNAVASRSLIQSINISKTLITPNSITLYINAEDYYVFVDEGVRGVQNTKPNTGKYSFKNLFVGKKMKDAIAEWISRKPIQVRQTKKQTTKSVMSQRDSMAYVVAKSIKKHGLRRTDFWSDTFNKEAYEELGRLIATALGKDANDFTLKIE